MDAKEYRLVACNPAISSENRIHSDDVARQHGFRGGLVPGVTVFGYLVYPLVDLFGYAWIGSGTASVRFRSPCYDGDLVVVRVTPDASAETADLAVSVGSTECVSGAAAIPPLDGTALDIPAAPVPDRDRRPPASTARLAPGTVLGSIHLPADEDSLVAYLDRIQEPSAVYADKGWVHPGMLLEGANWVLSANVVLPPWLHVETDLRYRRTVEVGEQIVVRGRVANEWEHKGHRFVALEVAWTAGTEEVASARHTSIWRLALRQ